MWTHFEEGEGIDIQLVIVGNLGIGSQKSSGISLLNVVGCKLRVAGLDAYGNCQLIG